MTGCETARMDIVSIGHILKETLILKDGSRRLVLGSPAAYTTVCAGRIGARVGIVTRCGGDMPEDLLRAFDDAGVDQKGLRRGAACTTTNELGYDSAGRKRILRYLAKAPTIMFEDIPRQYYSSRVFYCCGVESDIDPDVVNRLASLGGMMASDIGGLGGTGRPESTPSPFDVDPEGYKRLISHFRVMKASDDDVMILTGCGQEDVSDFIRQMLSWGPEVVLLTKGDDGTVICTKSGFQRVPVVSCEAVDTTGAGDCFMAGFLVNYAETGDLLGSVRFGSVVASYVVGGAGGAVAGRMPTREQVRQGLQNQYS